MQSQRQNWIEEYRNLMCQSELADFYASRAVAEGDTRDFCGWATQAESLKKQAQELIRKDPLKLLCTQQRIIH